MKNALISILLLCSVLTFGQVTRGYSFQVTPHSALGSWSDDFSTYTAGSLNGQGNWVQGNGTISVNSTNNSVYPNSSSTYSISYYDGSYIDGDASAEITMTDINATAVAPAICINGDSCYTILPLFSTARLIIIIDGSPTVLATGDELVDDDVVKIARVGNEIWCYKNGSLDTSIDTDGKVTNTVIMDGYLGISSVDAASNADSNDWEGNEL